MTQEYTAKLGTHGGDLRKASEQYGFLPQEWLDFSANINPLGLAPSIRAAIIRHLDDITNYPDTEAVRCKQVIAGYYALPYDKLVIGNGAVELIYLMAYVLRPQRVLIPIPTFSEYERAIRNINGQVRYFSLPADKEFRLDPDEFIDMLGWADMCFLCNPNNPSGSITRQADLEKIISAAEKLSVRVVLDESFMDFVTCSPEYTCRHLSLRYDNLVIIHSLTKFFAIPGLRLGFGVMPGDLARTLDKAKDPWNVNTLAQIAAVTALQDKDYINETINLIEREKQFMFDELNKIDGIASYRPAANFLLLKMNHAQLNSTALCDAAARRGILIRDCSLFPGLDENYVRVAVKGHEENRRLIYELRDLLGAE